MEPWADCFGGGQTAAWVNRHFPIEENRKVSLNRTLMKVFFFFPGQAKIDTR